ncbi:kelch repeat-containing protein [Bacteroidota bacterium]
MKKLIYIQILLFITANILQAQYGTWDTTRTPMPIEKWAQGSAVVDGRIYLIGGFKMTDENAWNSGAVSGIEVYDPATDTWDTTKINMPTARGYSATVALNKKVYVIGGDNLTSGYAAGNILEVYDTETDTWDTNRALMPTARMGCKAVVLENKIYVAGAWDTDRDRAVSFEVYDPITDQWEVLPDMLEPAGVMSMDTLNGKIYITGGCKLSYENIQKTIQIYAPDTNSWHISDAELPDAYWSHGSCVLGERIYIFGAEGPPMGLYMYSGYPIVLMFDTENNILFKVSDLPTPRAFSSVHLIDGQVYVIGGMETEMDQTHYLNGLHTEVEVYTPIVNPIYAKDVFLNQKYVDPDNDYLSVKTNFVNKLNTDITAFATFKSTDGLVNDSVLLYDDGLHEDVSAQDGIYGTYISVDSENDFILGISSINAGNGDYFIREDIDRFTSIGPIKFDGFLYTSEDTIPNPGDRISFKPILKNRGEIIPATNINARITCIDTFGSISDRTVSFDDIGPGETIIGANPKSLTISDNCPDNTEIKLKIDISSNLNYYWTDTITVLVKPAIVGIKENEIVSKINLYPNPTNSIINITGLTKPAEVKIYSIQGKLLKTETQVENTIDISELPAGIYFLKLLIGNNTQVKKTVIKK